MAERRSGQPAYPRKNRTHEPRNSSRYITNQLLDDPCLARTASHLNNPSPLATRIQTVQLAGSQRWVLDVFTDAGVAQIFDKPAREGAMLPITPGPNSHTSTAGLHGCINNEISELEVQGMPCCHGPRRLRVSCFRIGRCSAPHRFSQALHCLDNLALRVTSVQLGAFKR